MKKNILVVAIFLAIISFVVSCQPKPSEKKETTTNEPTTIVMASKDYSIDVEASTINWKGATLLGKEHTGTIKIKEGKLGTNEVAVVKGKFTIDMSSIENTDITDKAKNAKLVVHLKDADFFDTEKFQTASLDILSITALVTPTESSNNTVKANLTIKGITKEISFPAMIKVSDIGVLANATLEINRKDWGIMYGTEGSIAGLTKDKIIKNEIEFSVNLIAK